MFCMLEKVEWRDSEGEKKHHMRGKTGGLNCLKNNYKIVNVFSGKKEKEESLF